MKKYLLMDQEASCYLVDGELEIDIDVGTEKLYENLEEVKEVRSKLPYLKLDHFDIRNIFRNKDVKFRLISILEVNVDEEDNYSLEDITSIDENDYNEIIKAYEKRKEFT